MEINIAVHRLSALAQEGRLAAFRLLVKAGKDGMAAGDIARALGVPANTLSAQLTVLSQAGLITSTRKGRSIIYAVQIENMAGLLVYLVEDCCQGHGGVCAPLMHVTARMACC